MGSHAWLAPSSQRSFQHGSEREEGESIPYRQIGRADCAKYRPSSEGGSTWNSPISKVAFRSTTWRSELLAASSAVSTLVSREMIRPVLIRRRMQRQLHSKHEDQSRHTKRWPFRSRSTRDLLTSSMGTGRLSCWCLPPRRR